MLAVRREVYVAGVPVETPPIGRCGSGFFGDVCANSANGSVSAIQITATRRLDENVIAVLLRRDD